MVLSPITNRENYNSPLSSTAAVSRRMCGGERPRPLADVANKLHHHLSPRTPDTASISSMKAVPFPTISEDESEVFTYEYDAEAEAARGREWAKEIARRQENIKELRDRKLKLEQAHASRPRKQQQQQQRQVQSAYLGGGRKLSADDVDFLVELHASVVWRLWHAELSAEVFASERNLATRLHLALMRHGRKDLPVPPIVPVAKAHHLHLTTTTTSSPTSSPPPPSRTLPQRQMIDKDRPGIMTLPQLVAKSLLRQGQSKKGKRSHSRGRTPPPTSSECVIGARRETPSSPLAKAQEE